MWNLLDFFFPPRNEELLVRALASVQEYMQITSLSRTKPETVGLLEFHDRNVRALIHEAKYHRNIRAFRLLGSVLSEYMLEHGEEYALSQSSCILVPIPLSAKRRRERGYNQVEEILKHASFPKNVHVNTSLLKKIRETESQTKMSRQERLKNQEGAFAAKACDKRAQYLLIDDVITTGATLTAAYKALRAAGAKHVDILAFAY
jgi:ComF family protein